MKQTNPGCRGGFVEHLSLTLAQQSVTKNVSLAKGPFTHKAGA